MREVESTLCASGTLHTRRAGAKPPIPARRPHGASRADATHFNPERAARVPTPVLSSSATHCFAQLSAIAKALDMRFSTFYNGPNLKRRLPNIFANVSREQIFIAEERIRTQTKNTASSAEPRRYRSLGRARQRFREINHSVCDREILATPKPAKYDCYNAMFQTEQKNHKVKRIIQ